MLTSALLLLAVWAAGVLGLYEGGAAVHVPLLIGLLLLLISFLRAREASSRGGRSGPTVRS